MAIEKLTSNGLFLKVAVTVACTLMAAGVVGAIANYANVAAIRATVEEMNRRMDRIETKVDNYISKGSR